MTWIVGLLSNQTSVIWTHMPVYMMALVWKHQIWCAPKNNFMHLRTSWHTSPQGKSGILHVITSIKHALLSPQSSVAVGEILPTQKAALSASCSGLCDWEKSYAVAIMAKDFHWWSFFDPHQVSHSCRREQGQFCFVLSIAMHTLPPSGTDPKSPGKCRSKRLQPLNEKSGPLVDVKHQICTPNYIQHSTYGLGPFKTAR